MYDVVQHSDFFLTIRTLRTLGQTPHVVEEVQKFTAANLCENR